MVGILLITKWYGQWRGRTITPRMRSASLPEIQLRSHPCRRISESSPWVSAISSLSMWQTRTARELAKMSPLDDTWNYADILWNGIQAEKVQRAFEKLNFRAEQTLLEKRLAVCMTCGRVGSWKNRPTFEDLAVMFEGSAASGAERAYRKASGQADGASGCRGCCSMLSG